MIVARCTSLALLLLSGASAFTVLPSSCQSHHQSTPSVTIALREAPQSSRFEGNQRVPSAEENALMDEMIKKMAVAKPYELPNAVKRAFKVIRSPQFFMRIALLADAAETPEAKQQYEALATNLVTTLEAVVETTSEQLDERAQAVEGVVKAAAEPESGEFLVPLTIERVRAMRDTIEKLPESELDEGFLSTLDAWIVKSHQDGMDLMVGILQKVLQMYAGLQIKRALERQGQDTTPSTDNSAVNMYDLLTADAEHWDALLNTQQEPAVSSIKKDVQKTMESVVLSLETGSMAQQVQAEYLKELLERVESAEKKFA